MAYLFLARNVRFVTEPTGDDLEEQELIHLSRVEVQRAMLDGHGVQPFDVLGFQPDDLQCLSHSLDPFKSDSICACSSSLSPP